MSNKFASGKNAISECDRCGQQFKLTALKEIIVRTRKTNVMVCPQCWEPDHPQNMQGMYPVQDPQGLRNPRPDKSLALTGGDYSSRDIQWGWNPVGGARFFDNVLTPNSLVAAGITGTVTVTIA
jgi:hypothetical protein|tara:strand:+ start:1271 stop:1642 length:372 start_codon:yes stop_codon:yes gene_type:complete